MDDLVKSCFTFLDLLNKALEGENANEELEVLVAEEKKKLMQKFKTLPAPPDDGNTRPIASDESKKRLRKLKQEVEKANSKLEILRDGLKEFELEVAMMSGISETLEAKKRLRQSITPESRH